MCYAFGMEIPSTPSTPLTQAATSPASQALQVLENAVVAPSEADCAAMLAEEMRFADTPELRAAAVKLLSAGWTVRHVAIRLGVRASTVWHWSTDPLLVAAIERGKKIRTQKLGEGLQEAAQHAVQALTDVVSDDSVAPKDRIKAAEVVLDRVGINGTHDREPSVAISVDIDFDDRLARIVAGSQG